MKVIEVDRDTVYIQHRQLWSDELNKPLYETIDWLQLAKQKMELLKLSAAREQLDNPLDGIISLIDAVQDDADAKGYPVVWAYNADEWQSGKLEIQEYQSE